MQVHEINDQQTNNTPAKTDPPGMSCVLMIIMVLSGISVLFLGKAYDIMSNQETHAVIQEETDKELAEWKAKEDQLEAERKVSSQQSRALYTVVLANINREGHDLKSLTDYEDGMTYDPVRQQIVIAVDKKNADEDVRFQVTTKANGLNIARPIKPPQPAVPAP